MFASLILSVILNALNVMFLAIWSVFKWFLIPILILLLVFGIAGFIIGITKK